MTLSSTQSFPIRHWLELECLVSSKGGYPGPLLLTMCHFLTWVSGSEICVVKDVIPKAQSETFSSIFNNTDDFLDFAAKNFYQSFKPSMMSLKPM